MAKAGTINTRKEVAFYYPGPVWTSGDWVKNLILFFDGIALLVPDYIRNKPHVVDPAIAAGLDDEGLLHILEPEKLIDKAAAEKLSHAMTDVIQSGALDSLSKDGTAFHELSYSRLGSYGDPGLAEGIFRELKARKLARDTEDGKSIPMHPMVRGLVLVMLSQILRPYGPGLGFELSPATDRFKLVDALSGILSAPGSPSSGHVVSLDLEAVGVDLGPVPINEVLAFRKENLPQHREYARSVRKFVNEISVLPKAKMATALEDRQEEIKDLAAGLRSISRKAWKRPAYFALTLMGAAWAFGQGGVLGALLGLGVGVIGAPAREPLNVGAYSYLFRAAEEYGL